MLDTTIPPCDLLIVAGDQCPDGIGRVWACDDASRQRHWFQTTWMEWRHRQPAAHCVVTWGNHDFCGLHGEYGDATTDVVVDGLVTINGIKIWLSPWTKQFMNWAFMAEEHVLAEKFKAIPEGIDILVTHDPPKGFGDAGLDWDTKQIRHFGSQAVLDTVARVKPKVVICGHIHDAYGIYNIDVCPHGTNGQVSCACRSFHSVTVYNVALASGRATTGTLFLPDGRKPMEIVL